MDERFKEVNISVHRTVKPTFVARIKDPLLTLGSLDNYIAVNIEEMTAAVFYFSNGIVTYGGTNNLNLMIKNNKIYAVMQYNVVELEEDVQKKFFELQAEKELLS